MLSERQEQIIKASIDLIDNKGIQGFTIKNLSKAIGISEPAIYRHFESKFEILATILDNFQIQITSFHNKFKDIEGDAFAKLSMLLKNRFTSFAENPALVSVVFSEEIFQNEKKLIEKVNEIYRLNENILISILQQAKDENQIDKSADVEILALMVLGSIRLLVKKWKMTHYSFNLQVEGQKLQDNTLKLFKKDNK
ncbi:MAG: TetR/AcrR family transcriptional regulator [Bacteroidota bacterium]